nr:MAG TPA: hypothetical protein [Caudoviricetes sp.]
MGKIDISKIEGYNEMSAEDKVKALESYEYADTDYTGYVRKDVFDKTASELAQKKKELKEKMSEDEQKAQEDKEAREKLQADYESLLRENKISKYKANYLSMGYDSKLADEMAVAMADGDVDKLFKNQVKQNEILEKKIKAEILAGTPKPNTNNNNKSMTLEDLRKMSPQDRLEFSEKNPEEYKALYEGENNDA